MYKDKKELEGRAVSVGHCALPSGMWNNLTAHGDADLVTPLADALVADSEDGFVGPLGWRGGGWRSV
jgi:hypothetical protein